MSNTPKALFGFIPCSRAALYHGIGRKAFCIIIPGIASLVILAFLLYINDAYSKSLADLYPSSKDVFKFACGISAALTIMTYNLRNKAFDYFKAELSSEHHADYKNSEILDNARGTSEDITNITLISFITTLLTGLSIPLLDNTSIWGNAVVAACMGMLTYSFFSYLYVLFAIEYAEIKACENIVVAKEWKAKKESREANQKSTLTEDTEISKDW